MSLAEILEAFCAEMFQCDKLIVHAHGLDGAGTPILPAVDQSQVTVAAFLNMFIAWETFLEAALAGYMTGEATINGKFPVRFVSPPDAAAARAMVIGTHRYFDYGNHENVKKVALMFFRDGVPFEPHISEIFGELADIRTMRNSSAHITSTTQTALEALALRIFASPKPGIGLYQLLTSTDPRPPGKQTVLASYREKLLAAAGLISHG